MLNDIMSKPLLLNPYLYKFSIFALWKSIVYYRLCRDRIFFGRFGAVKSYSTHHFFGNACTKSGPLRFPVFDWFCLFVDLWTEFLTILGQIRYNSSQRSTLWKSIVYYRLCRTVRSSSYTIWFQMRCWMTSCTIINDGFSQSTALTTIIPNLSQYC
jgi:hypothetical protein